MRDNICVRRIRDKQRNEMNWESLVLESATYETTLLFMIF